MAANQADKIADGPAPKKFAPYNIRLDPDLRKKVEKKAKDEFPYAGRGATAQVIRRLLTEYVDAPARPKAAGTAR